MSPEQLWQAQQLAMRPWWSWRPGCGCFYADKGRTGRITAVAKAGIFVQMDDDPDIHTNNVIYQRLIAVSPQLLIPNLADPTGATQGILQQMLHDFLVGQLPPEHQNILEQTTAANVQALLSMYELPA